MKLKYWKKRCVIRGCIPKHTLTMTCSAVYFLYPAPKKAQHFPENNSVFNKTALGKKEASLCHPHSKIQYGREGVSHCHQGYSLTCFIITFTYPDWEKLHDFDISYCLILSSLSLARQESVFLQSNWKTWPNKLSSRCAKHFHRASTFSSKIGYVPVYATSLKTDR